MKKQDTEEIWMYVEYMWISLSSILTANTLLFIGKFVFPLGEEEIV